MEEQVIILSKEDVRQTGNQLCRTSRRKGRPSQTVTRPIPTVSLDEVLVRNYAIATNPVDWKMQDSGSYIQSYPAVLGSDGCGIIAAVGSSVTKFKVRDRVTGFAGVIFLGNADHGAFQTYTLVKEITTLKLPDFLSFEEGATFPMAFATAAIALYVVLGVPRPTGTVEQWKKAS
jgi:NADPH:quinone reductase-like Zn-dependent oxidoreductase